MRRLLAVIFLTLLAVTAPWRLLGLFVETLVISPGLTRTQQTTDHYWQARDLEAKLGWLGWDVSYEDGMDGYCDCYGLTSPSKRTIMIESSLSWDARFAVLAHEAGHALTHARLTENQGEVYAESVAALVAHDGLLEHARYLSAMRGDLLTMLVYSREIYATAYLLEH